eukprot:403339120
MNENYNTDFQTDIGNINQASTIPRANQDEISKQHIANDIPEEPQEVLGFDEQYELMIKKQLGGLLQDYIDFDWQKHSSQLNKAKSINQGDPQMNSKEIVKTDYNVTEQFKILSINDLEQKPISVSTYKQNVEYSDELKNAEFAPVISNESQGIEAIGFNKMFINSNQRELSSQQKDDIILIDSYPEKYQFDYQKEEQQEVQQEKMVDILLENIAKLLNSNHEVISQIQEEYTHMNKKDENLNLAQSTLANNFSMVNIPSNEINHFLSTENLPVVQRASSSSYYLNQKTKEYRITSRSGLTSGQDRNSKLKQQVIHNMKLDQDQMALQIGNLPFSQQNTARNGQLSKSQIHNYDSIQNTAQIQRNNQQQFQFNNMILDSQGMLAKQTNGMNIRSNGQGGRHSHLQSANGNLKSNGNYKIGNSNQHVNLSQPKFISSQSSGNPNKNYDSQNNSINNHFAQAQTLNMIKMKNQHQQPFQNRNNNNQFIQLQNKEFVQKLPNNPYSNNKKQQQQDTVLKINGMTYNQQVNQRNQNLAVQQTQHNQLSHNLNDYDYSDNRYLQTDYKNYNGQSQITTESFVLNNPNMQQNSVMKSTATGSFINNQSNLTTQNNYNAFRPPKTNQFINQNDRRKIIGKVDQQRMVQGQFQQSTQQQKQSNNYQSQINYLQNNMKKQKNLGIVVKAQQIPLSPEKQNNAGFVNKNKFITKAKYNQISNGLPQIQKANTNVVLNSEQQKNMGKQTQQQTRNNLRSANISSKMVQLPIINQ